MQFYYEWERGVLCVRFKGNYKARCMHWFQEIWESNISTYFEILHNKFVKSCKTGTWFKCTSISISNVETCNELVKFLNYGGGIIFFPNCL